MSDHHHVRPPRAAKNDLTQQGLDCFAAPRSGLARMGRTKALLAPGDRVRLAGLTAAGLNGKLGTMVAYHRDKQRYEIEVDGAPGSKAIKECNLEMLPPSPQGSATPRVHILVPCHIASPRRLVTFMRCAKSVAHQTVGGFCVFVGLSGPRCKECLESSICPDKHVMHAAYHPSGRRWGSAGRRTHSA